MVREITADDGATARPCRNREIEEIDAGKRRRELVEPARGEGGGGRGDRSGGRRARLLARMGVGRRSDGLRVIVIVLAPAASRPR